MRRAATSTPTARPESSSRARPTAARRGDRRSSSTIRTRRTTRSSQRLALDEATGAMMVVYYDTILDPGRVKTNLWMQQSLDRGVSWTAPVRVTTAETDETSAGATSSFQYGDYIGLTGFAGNFFPCWTDRRERRRRRDLGRATHHERHQFHHREEHVRQGRSHGRRPVRAGVLAGRCRVSRTPSWA